MRCLIRYVLRRGKVETSYRDQEVETDVLTVGQATDQDVFLSDVRVALKHATLTPTGKKQFQVRSVALSGVRINGLLTQSGFIQIGDRLGIGASELQLIEPPEGYDLALEVETRSSAKDFAAIYRSKAKLNLAATKIRKRPWSWALSLLVLIVFLALPMVQVFYEECSAEQARETGGTCTPMAQASAATSVPLLKDLPLPDDELWLSGELAAAHHFFGTECRLCHQKPFIMVRDQACAGCHAKTPHHTDAKFQDLQTLKETRCATCHKEHYGEHALIRFDSGLCADCHEDLQQTIATQFDTKTDLLNASDFGTDHPEFRVTLVSLDYEGVESRERISLNEGGLQERSNLKFPHDTHLKEEGVKGPEGNVKLNCASCHIPEPGGAEMRPIDMETLCQDCHRLTFEPKDPQRQVPHGDVREVLYALQEYYAAQALAGDYQDESAPAVVRTRRRPGSRLSEAERLEALDWACKKTAQVSTEVFEARLCGSCHEVRKLPSDPLQPCMAQWDVLPARVAQTWLPKAQFTHAKHKTMDCKECHPASTSPSSKDILLPPIDNCRQCHGGTKAVEKLRSTCVDCHGFHIAEHALMTDRVLSGKDE